MALTELPNKRILYLITVLAFGGAETQLMRLAVMLKQRGWDIIVVSMMPPTAYTEKLFTCGISIISLGIRKGNIDLLAFFRFIRILKLEKPDILNTFLVHANFFGRLARLFVHIPVLISSSRNIFEGGGIRDWWYRLTDFLCDMTTHVSKAGLERYIKEKLSPASKIMYIPNGVDVLTFRKNDDSRQRIRDSFGIKDDFVWLAVGRFEKAKDYHNMIQAFHQLTKTPCVLWITGDGSLRYDMEKLIKELKLENGVKLLGVRADIPDLMSSADAYVMSSAWEGMPNVLLEAAACELPIVTTAVGENSEIVLDGKNGFLVPPKEPEKLAEAMQKLLALTKEERLKMGKAGRQFIEDKYSLEHVADIWEELYKSFSKVKKA